MRKGTLGHLLLIFGIFCCFGLPCAESRNEKNQQTFVVRYKHGEQTIPVTVVLDNKKQTEYVINMSPRATTKTVTLYDFKQKTIAYKDVTNRECFLGHLTHETLSEEVDALTRIQNPVEHQPKMLSLDPHRSSLTPTEIRNMAGQKTAVFCRKMNTWLVLPRETHNVKKREVDEIDERTYHRRGYHTVQYAHYGYERRRRFRNSNRNTTRPLALRRNGASETSNEKIGNSEIRQPHKINVLPGESLSIQKSSNPESSGISSNGKELFAYPLSNHHTPSAPYPSETTDPPESVFHHPTFETNSNYERDLFPTLHPHYLNGPNEYELQSALNSGIYTNANPRDHIGHNRKEVLSNIAEKDLTTLKNPNIFENLKEPFVPNSEARRELNNLNVQSAFYNRENAKESLHPELPKTKNEFKESNNNQSMNRDPGFYLNGNLRQSEIEKEGGFDQHSNIHTERFLPKVYDKHDVSENSDVSINVLEIPKITKKFENLDNQLHPNPIIQTNEDVHDVFEGFFNLSRSHPPPGQEDFHNSYFTPVESNRGRSSDNLNAHAYPPSPDLNIINNSGSSNQWRNNASPFSNQDETFSTDFPILTTNTYDNYNHATSVPDYSNIFINPGTINSNQITDESLSMNFAPRRIDHNSRKWDDTLNRPVPISNNNHGNIFHKATDTHSPALTPLNKHPVDKHFNHRSDIPSESDHTENIESVTLSNIEDNLTKPTKQPSHVSLDSIPEGVSSHQIRFQNAFRNYKPDEIIIDVGRIPTQPPPDSTLRLQSRTYPGDEYPNRRISPTLIRPLGGQKSELATGETWHGRPIQAEDYPRTNNLPTRHQNRASFQTRKNNLLLHYPRNDSNQFLQNRQQHDNSIRQITYPNQNMASHQINSYRPYHHLNNLPPGVSIHPRHPKAPYADMFHSNMPPHVAQGNNLRTLKPHRQRHHKKKDRLPNSCCKTNGNPVSCCRSGGSCCPPHRGRDLRVKQPCCSSTKHKNEHYFPQRPNQIVIPNRVTLRQNQAISQNSASPRHNQVATQNKFLPPQQVRKTAEDQKDRCQKEKLCRTLYESTQQVMVCRNAQIDGC